MRVPVAGRPEFQPAPIGTKAVDVASLSSSGQLRSIASNQRVVAAQVLPEPDVNIVQGIEREPRETVVRVVACRVELEQDMATIGLAIAVDVFQQLEIATCGEEDLCGRFGSGLGLPGELDGVHPDGPHSDAHGVFDAIRKDDWSFGPAIAVLVGEGQYTVGRVAGVPLRREVGIALNRPHTTLTINIDARGSRQQRVLGEEVDADTWVGGNRWCFGCGNRLAGDEEDNQGEQQRAWHGLSQSGQS